MDLQKSKKGGEKMKITLYKYYIEVRFKRLGFCIGFAKNKTNVIQVQEQYK